MFPHTKEFLFFKNKNVCINFIAAGRTEVEKHNTGKGLGSVGKIAR
jgi:hypothetical protein